MARACPRPCLCLRPLRLGKIPHTRTTPSGAIWSRALLEVMAASYVHMLLHERR